MERKVKFDINYLLKEKLLAKIPASKQKAEESMTTSLSWLEESKKNFKNKLFKSCVLTAYLAMFHSARTILFFDGFREKSHFAIARYLEDKYLGKKLEKEWIELLDYYRDLRHQDQYRTSFVMNEQEAERSIGSAEKFVNRMNKLLKELKV